MTNMRDTSLETFFNIKWDGTLSEREEQVLSGFQTYGAHTALSISRLINLPINTVVGRINSLKDSECGLIIEFKGLGYNPETGETVSLYAVKGTQRPTQIVRAFDTPCIKYPMELTLNGFKDFGAHTNLEMSGLLHIPINSICTATNHWFKEGRLREGEKRPCQVTGRMAFTWLYVQQPEWFTKKQLKRRGWTEELITSLIKDNFETEDNPHGIGLPPMYLYRIPYILSLEKCPDFKNKGLKI